MTIGVIADTHGLLRPEAVDALRGSDHILHAGDIGDPEILRVLEAIAPVSAIRGNNDDAPWAAGLPDELRLELAGVSIYLLHDRKQLAIDPGQEGIDVVIAGHSHKPLLEYRDGVLHLNPGAAGRRRFKLPITVALMRVHHRQVEVEHIDLLD
ncbi:metallophosphoesterase family protein [Pseudomonas matsuisoli]|nr:metallophosphoesterase family protein [Pseudomonas matsuisoli]